MAKLLTPPTVVHRAISSREALIEQLGKAVALELSTLPPYLTALYSIQDAFSEAFHVIKSVALEEMLHMSLAANMMAAIGGRPSFDASNVPEYPTYIPNAAGMPFIPLQSLSVQLLRSVFMGIEAPSDQRDPPPEGAHFQTIGQFYEAIREGFERCYAQLGDDLFVDPGGACQLTRREYLGGGEGRLFTISNMARVNRAIDQITAQGEGARPHAVAGDLQGYTGRFVYGMRADDTFGPLLGRARKPSHYGRFRELASGTVPIGSVWPMQPNVKRADLPGALGELSHLFNACYTLALSYIEGAYAGSGRESLYYGGLLPLMHSVLPPLAGLLLSTPIDPNSSVGPNAGPSFEYVEPRPTPEAVDALVRRLIQAPPGDRSASYAKTWQTTLSGVLPFLETLPRTT